MTRSRDSIPPEVLDAERSVLGAVLLRNEAIGSVNGLKPDHFIDFKNRVVFASMQALASRGQPIDAVTLGIELGRHDQLNAIGGLAYLSELLSVVPTADNIAFYAEAVEDSGRARLLRHDLGALLHDSRIGPEELAARAGKIVEAFGGGKAPETKVADPFENWSKLSYAYMTSQPPARRWLLRHPTRDGEPAPVGQGDGLLPMGKVGILASEGGAGKTNVVIALAVALVTGRSWLGHFDPDANATDGMVFVGLAEEDAEEIHRRFYNIAQLYQLTPSERALVSERVVALPLAGVGVALVGYGADSRSLVDTPALVSLRTRLNDAHRPWSLVLMDPLIRWAGPDVEKDNAMATRFVQALETLTQVAGGPTVLLPHHSSKLSRRDGGKADARGVTGLTDGARWVGSIRVEKAEAWFGQTKSNYSRPMLDELKLTRDDGGLLRAMSDSEAAAAQRAKDERDEERTQNRDSKKADSVDSKVNAMMPRLLAAIRSSSVKPTSRGDVAALIKGTDTVKQAAISRLIATKKIVRVPAQGGQPAHYREVYGEQDDEL